MNPSADLTKGQWIVRLQNARTFAFLEAAIGAAANFAISITVARTYSTTVFSGYIAALSVAFVAIAFIRVIFLTPSAVKSDHWYQRKSTSIVATHLIILALVTASSSIVLTLVGMAMQNSILHVSAMATPCLCLWFIGWEFERSFLIKNKQHSILLLITVFYALTVLILLFLVHNNQAPFWALILSIAVLGLSRSLFVVSLAGMPRWQIGYRQLKHGLKKLGVSSAAYLFGGVMCSHAPVFALSFYAMPDQAAAFGAMRTLYQPVQIFFRSRDVVLQTRFHADRMIDVVSLENQFRRNMFKVVWISTLLTAVLLILGPWLVHIVYAGKFDAHQTTYWLWALIMTLINLAAICDTYVTYAGLQVHYARVQLCAGACVVLMSLLMARIYGDSGSAVAAIFGWSVIVVGGTLLVQKHGDTLRAKPKCS